MTSAKANPLEYAPARKRRLLRPLRTTLLLLLLIGAYFGWRYRTPITVGTKHWWAERQCLNYSPPHDQVAYEQSPFFGNQLVQRDPSYKQKYYSQMFRTGVWSMEGTWKQIDPWEAVSTRTGQLQYSGNFFTTTRGQPSATVFLHERQCPGRPPRLVVVELEGSHLHYASHVIATGSFSGEAIEIWHGSNSTIEQPLNSWGFIRFGDNPVSARAYAGQIDPKNSAKFSIRHAINDEEYMVHGELLPDDTVRLEGLKSRAAQELIQKAADISLKKSDTQAKEAR